eukprot:2528996-Rhodomonas_salina.1
MPPPGSSSGTHPTSPVALLPTALKNGTPHYLLSYTAMPTATSQLVPPFYRSVPPIIESVLCAKCSRRGGRYGSAPGTTCRTDTATSRPPPDKKEQTMSSLPTVTPRKRWGVLALFATKAKQRPGLKPGVPQPFAPLPPPRAR